MKLLILIIDFILIFWAVIYTAQIKINTKRILAYILIISCPTGMIYFWVGQWQGIIFLIASSCIYFLGLSKNFLTLIHICFVLITGVLTDNFTQYVIIVLPFNFLPSILEQYCIFIVLFIINIIIYQLTTKKIYILFNEMKGSYLLILFVVFVTMSTFYINIYLTDYLSKDTLLKFNIITQVTYFAIVIFVLYFTSKNIKKESDFQKIKFENAQFTDYMHSLELINNDMQKFRHDHGNILFTMQGYIDTNDFEGLKQYFKKHIFSIEEDTLRKNKQLANLSKLKITGIKGLILTKTLQAEKEGILVNIEVPDVIEEINMNIIDIARILGIFLDNAIEATNQIDFQKEINVAFFKSVSDSLIIVIENPIGEKSINIEQIFAEDFSTKGFNRGKGLSNVKNILTNYPNVALNTNATNGLFTQIIVIE
ncbi:MAG: GHKL domain-containing protein [Solibacillus sp.]